MSYCTGKNIEIARGKALKMLLIEKKPISIVANHYGVNRTTVWRWLNKWQEQNKYVQLYNENKLRNNEPSINRLSRCTWVIPTLSSAPKNPHSLSNELVELVLDVRDQLKRCAEVVWHYINQILCIRISLSSVRRILKRHGAIEKRHRNKNRKFKGIKRPLILAPGDLVETDTIHLYNPVTGNKRYVYTVIDLYTRMTYARVYRDLKPGHAVNTILEASQYFGFKFKMVQSDNGSEFSTFFEDNLMRNGISIRHTRLGRPNDNAHIERFNRTIQEECTGNYFLESVPLGELDKKILNYVDYYNYHRIHLGLSYRTPASMLHSL